MHYLLHYYLQRIVLDYRSQQSIMQIVHQNFAIPHYEVIAHLNNNHNALPDLQILPVYTIHCLILFHRNILFSYTH